MNLELKSALLAICVCLSSCVSLPEKEAALPAASNLAAMMAGVFRTAPDDPENNFKDRRLVLPALGEGEWVYIQLNSGPEQTLYRQRVFQLVDIAPGVVKQNTWSFAEPEAQKDILERPGGLQSLTLADLTGSFDAPGCGQTWRYQGDGGEYAWRGRVNPATCQIFSKRRNRKIGIEGETRLSEAVLKQTERGYDLEGKQIWGSKPGEFAVLYRAK